MAMQPSEADRMLTLDHLAVVAPDLAEGVAHVRDCLGLGMPEGGRHREMGTRNHLLRLGEATFLEVIAVDPEAPVPPLALAMATSLEQATGGGFGYRDAGYPPGIHPGDLAPVRWTYPRGNNVLTEAMFLSNPAQATKLHQPAFLDRLAQAYVAAVEETLR
jgi:hypothetical protein